ncbi:MAG: NUDIX domain-containing protein [Anaerolineales bacterium]|nr:NUDIX domain-containing protein [Anaerolineales bacterium]
MSEITLDVRIVVFSLDEDTLQVLLLPCGEAPDCWTLPGGPVQVDESLEEAAGRALDNRVDREQVYLEQLYTYGEPQRVPARRLVSVSYFALSPANARCAARTESERWYPLEKVPGLVHDHAEIVKYALRRLRYKLEYSAAGFQLLPDEFTLSELQHTYEIVLGEKLDKRNFRRRILQSNIIEETNHLRTGEGQGRPARLYRYRPDAVAEVKARRLFP